MELCENCLRRHWRAKIDRKTGLQVKHRNGNLIYVCISCGNVQEEEQTFLGQDKKIKANILYIDIETSKSLYYNYGQKVPSKYLNIDDLVHEWYMISWAASYVDNDNVWSKIVTPKQAKEWDDSKLVEKLHGLMSSAEIIAGHNIDGFDIKKCNTRFQAHGLPPIVGKKTIDTLKVARKVYAFESNKLDYISQWLKIDGKDHIDNSDWLKAMAGHRNTLRKIHKYNRNDVINGKAVLMELMPAANKKPEYGAVKSTLSQLPVKAKV